MKHNNTAIPLYPLLVALKKLATPLKYFVNAFLLPVASNSEGVGQDLLEQTDMQNTYADLEISPPKV